MRGFLIALEGIDGAGKTTQARRLATALARRRWSVLLTREPSDGPQGRQIRQYLQGTGHRLSPLEELELFMADRRQHVTAVIRPALEQGQVVITDRYYYSSAAYQGAAGLDPAWILAQNEAFAPRPDLVFLLVLSPQLALTRRGEGSGLARQLTETAAYLTRVAAIYDTFTGPQFHRVDAALPEDEVHAAILHRTLTALDLCRLKPV